MKDYASLMNIVLDRKTTKVVSFPENQQYGLMAAENKETFSDR